MIKTVLITGGSTGIGRALAAHFARAGHHLILVALPGSELELAQTSLQSEYPEVDIQIYPVDLTQPGGPEGVWAFTSSKGLHVDVLVNNAGFGTWGPLHSIDREREVQMLELNILALYKLTRLYLGPMHDRNAGHLLFIASIAAFQPNPYMAVYGASKAFVRSLGLALYHELRDQGSNIRVTTVCPPAIPTAFQEVSGMSQSALYSGWLSSDVETVARAAWIGYARKKRQVIPTWYLPIVNVISRLMPEQLGIWLARQTLRKNLPGKSR